MSEYFYLFNLFEFLTHILKWSLIFTLDMLCIKVAFLAFLWSFIFDKKNEFLIG